MNFALLGLVCLAVTRVGERGRGSHGLMGITIVPVGAASPGTIEQLEAPIQESFGAAVRIGPPLRLPSAGYDAVRGQYLSTSILDALAAARGDTRDFVLGVADVDLYVPDLNFVFGEADPRRRVAVFSLARLASSNSALAARRAATEAIHELGHALGLSHCDNPRCVMWFSNTLAESDRKGTRFCPRHEAQIASLRRRSKAARTLAN